MSYPLMQCGCRAQGDVLTEHGPKPCCVVHDCDTVATPQPDLIGRVSSCCYCKATVPSGLGLPFFVYHPAKPTDEHYCGCRGWDQPTKTTMSVLNQVQRIFPQVERVVDAKESIAVNVSKANSPTTNTPKI